MAILKQLKVLRDGNTLSKVSTIANANPQVTDDAEHGFFQGASWLNQSTGVFYKLADQTAGAANWAAETFKADGSVAMTGVLDMDSHKISNITDGTSAQDAATVAQGIHNLVADPGASGAIAVTKSGLCSLTSAAAETRTLAIPTKDGQLLTLCMDVDGGDITVTAASAINQAGNNTIVLNDAGDSITLRAIKKAGARAWRIQVNDGCTLSTV